MRRKTRLCASLVFLVCIVAIFVYLATWAGRDFTVYNDSFKILDYKISRGKTHTFYEGNQTVGRIRAGLSSKFGLKFIGESPRYGTTTPVPEARVVFLRYRAEFPVEELGELPAVLTDGKEIFKKLPGGRMNAQSKDTFVGIYILPVLPASNESFRIDFKLDSTDGPVASWRLVLSDS